MPGAGGSLITQRVVWVGSAALVGAIVLGFLAPYQTNAVVSVAGMVSALILVLFGVVVLIGPEAGLAPRIMGAGISIAGIVLGFLIFGTTIVCGTSGQIGLAQLIATVINIVPIFALFGEPCSVTVVLGTVLFWGGIVLLVSSLP